MSHAHPTRRQFLGEATAFLTAAAAGSSFPCLLDPQTSFAQQSQKPSARVLVFSRSGKMEHAIVHREGDKLSVGERLLEQMARTIGVEVVCTKDGQVLDGDLGRFDGFIWYGNFDPTKPNDRGDPPVTSQGKKRLVEAVASGKGFLGIHCASYAFLSGDMATRQPLERRDEYVKMLGGELHGADTKQKVRYRIVSPRFPGVGQLGAAEIVLDDEPYGLKNFADDIHVIAVQETQGLRGKAFKRPPFPAIWARRHGRGRVFYAAWGHDEESWRSEPFGNVVLGGLKWILGRVDAELEPNLQRTAPEAEKIP